MLKNHKLLVDQNCPLCTLYGTCFTKFKIVEPSTVYPYQYAESEVTQHIDMEKATSEIALLDTEKKKARYGIDAMIYIVSNDNKILSNFLNSFVVYPLLKMLYAFVSANRKVIVIPPKSLEGRPCKPKLNLKLRLLYLLMVIFLVGFSIQNIGSTFYYSEVGLEQFASYILLGLGYLGMHAFYLFIIKENNIWTFLGHLATSWLIAVITSSIIFALAPYLSLSVFISLLTTNLTLVILQHRLRRKRLALPTSLDIISLIPLLVILSMIL